MKKRLFYTLIAAALLGAAFAVLTLPASAEKRTITVIVNGQPVTVTVDVPPGTPIENIEIPLLPSPTQPAPTPPPDGGEQTPAQPPSSGDDEPTSRRGEKQKKTGDEREAEDEAEQEAAEPQADVEARRKRRASRKRSRLRNEDGSPTRSNPGFFEALPGPQSVTGVPNFVIRKFRVPLFLLPIYQAAGIQYGIRWEQC